MTDEPHLPFPEFIADVQCNHCHQVVPQPFFVVKHFGRMTSQFAFCDEKCANAFYLDRLRKSGL